ncbi:MAG: urease accessory protein UreF [Minwuia sp.]|nr:urease accessory protein UreF [Minwuia sp.]
MPSDADLPRLLTWLSPSFPVGAYTYSHGLENAVERELIRDRATAGDWVLDLLEHGGGKADAVLLAEAWRAVTDDDATRLHRVVEEARALSATSELALETEAQGRAFLTAVAAAWPTPAVATLLASASRQPIAYAVAVGTAAAGQGIALQPVLVGYLHAFTANLVSAIVRLVPLGQTDGLHLLRLVEPHLNRLADEAANTTLDDIATCCLAADIASMQHEIQRTRLFRS